MIKKKLVELVQENLNNGSINGDIWKKAHPLVIQEYIGLAYDSIFYTIFKKTPDGVDVYGKWYYDQDIQLANGRYHVDLPCSVMQLPDNSTSIKRITLTDDMYSMVFAPLKSTASGFANRLGTVSRMGIITYRVENGTIWFEHFDPAITQVNIFAIVPFADFDDTDDIPIPAGQAVNLINQIVSFFQDKIPEDRGTDNT